MCVGIIRLNLTNYYHIIQGYHKKQDLTKRKYKTLLASKWILMS